MNTIGIVCEYNPFHNGHAMHIQKSRERLGEDSLVLCAMSGDFVQRGEAAIYSKFARAEAACRCGADLVLELPLPWSLSSAEGFARGAVGLLGRMGASHVCFGSETGDLGPLERIAKNLLFPGIQREVKARLAEDGSLSYAAARQLALADRMGEEAELLRQPNNILAVEYIKALYDLGLDMQPVPIRREGSLHDAPSTVTGLKSASEIRRMLSQAKRIEGEVPPAALSIYSREHLHGRELIRDALEQAYLSRLRMLPESAFEQLPDGANGLGRRLYRAVREEASLDAILAATKTKRYAMARIRRLTLCACLGIQPEMSAGIPPYARILAANKRGCEYLRQRETESLFPIVSKPAHVKQLSSDCAHLFAIGASAHDLYVLGYRTQGEQKPGLDWRTGPKII